MDVSDIEKPMENSSFAATSTWKVFRNFDTQNVKPMKHVSQEQNAAEM